LAKVKRHLNHDEEFQIMKLVLDKFLWLGVGIMGYGFYLTISLNNDLTYGLTVLGAGAILLLLFMAILVSEYNFLEHR